MSQALEGDVALITGAGGGIGRAVVDRFVAEGAAVCAMDLREDRLEAIRAAHGDAVRTVRGDVTRMADHRAAVAAAVEAFGRLDVFVGNAGITDGFRDLADMDDETLEAAYEQIFDVNVRGYVLGAKAALAELARTRGCMIFTLSNASFHPDGGGVLYIASKHADLGIVRQLAHELAPVVRVNGVAAGPTRTDIRLPDALAGGGTADADSQPADAERLIRDRTPLAHWADPAEHTGAYVLLASRTDGRLITGAAIRTDAGLDVRGLIRTRGGDDLLERLGL